MRDVFEVSGLTYGTPTGRVLQRNMSFTLGTSEMLLITGSNGCGKSTLLKTLLGQFPAESGTVRCNVASDRIEYIPQLENTEIHLPLTLRDVLSISRKEPLDEEKVESFGLLSRSQLGNAWNTASGGERKRTLLTRALMRGPSMLVFDEPMNHLDELSRRAMVRVMAEFLSEEREVRAIVMVCHQGIKPNEEQLFKILHLNLDKRMQEVH